MLRRVTKRLGHYVNEVRASRLVAVAAALKFSASAGALCSERRLRREGIENATGNGRRQACPVKRRGRMPMHVSWFL